jgi:esterase/lipase
LGFLALEYSGHGKSSGKFTNGNISKWSKETSIVIKKIVKKNKIILVGSSMGAWISLIQFQYFKKQIKGFLGIGSAPEFLERLMWKKFKIKEKKEIKKNGIINLKHGDYEYPITYQLIKDGRKNKILHKKIYQKIKVTMVHGSKDKSVPVHYSKKVLNIFKNSKKKLVIVKNGDHSLSSPKWLRLLKKELKLIIN